MKSATIIFSTILASAVMAQPSPKHLPHLAMHKRNPVTEVDWTTIVDYVTKTVQPGEQVEQQTPTPPAQQPSSAPSVSPSPVNKKVEAKVGLDTPPTTLSTSAASISASASTAPSVAPLNRSGGSGFTSPLSTSGRATTCSSGSDCNGQITFFSLSDSMSCGYTGLAGNDNSLSVIALPFAMMGELSNNGANQPTNPNCNRQVQITCPQSGKSTTATVVDKCMSCDGAHIDLSQKTFSDLGIDQTQGVANVNWSFLD